MEQAREWCAYHRIIAVYREKCCLNTDELLRSVDSILQAAGQGIVRVQGDYGYDMLAGFEDRQRISEGRQDKILWFSRGCLRNWKLVYQKYFGWDSADANTNFPGFYDKIIVLDGLRLAREICLQLREARFGMTGTQRHEGKREMSIIAAQVSLYPLRQESIGPAIREAVRVLRGRGLKARVGEMSTVVWGEEQVIFGALQEAFHQAAERGDTVMTVTLSNACPSPEEP